MGQRQTVNPPLQPRCLRCLYTPIEDTQMQPNNKQAPQHLKEPRVLHAAEAGPANFVEVERQPHYYFCNCGAEVELSQITNVVLLETVIDHSLLVGLKASSSSRRSRWVQPRERGITAKRGESICCLLFLEYQGLFKCMRWKGIKISHLMCQQII